MVADGFARLRVSQCVVHLVLSTQTVNLHGAKAHKLWPIQHTLRMEAIKISAYSEDMLDMLIPHIIGIQVSH